ncbi:hypothetical protein FB451DRAFT_1183016 [Mycena latifolia]|nr:hypothetical protein FB451DRAFT_1183016 [Mycena latifolia]
MSSLWYWLFFLLAQGMAIRDSKSVKIPESHSHVQNAREWLTHRRRTTPLKQIQSGRANEDTKSTRLRAKQIRTLGCVERGMGESSRGLDGHQRGFDHHLPLDCSLDWYFRQTAFKHVISTTPFIPFELHNRKHSSPAIVQRLPHRNLPHPTQPVLNCGRQAFKPSRCLFTKKLPMMHGALLARSYWVLHPASLEAEMNETLCEVISTIGRPNRPGPTEQLRIIRLVVVRPHSLDAGTLRLMSSASRVHVYRRSNLQVHRIDLQSEGSAWASADNRLVLLQESIDTAPRGFAVGAQVQFAPDAIYDGAGRRLEKGRGCGRHLIHTDGPSLRLKRKKGGNTVTYQAGLIVPDQISRRDQ